MSSGFPIHKTRIEVPHLHDLRELRNVRELEEFLRTWMRVWEERDRELSFQSSNPSEIAKNIMEWSDGVPVNDGILDATDTFKRALADTRYSSFYIPDGDYMLDEIIVTRRTRWIASPNATLYMRTAVAGDAAIFRFNAGSNESSWYGGRFDGRRSALAASFTPGENWHWTGIRVAGGASEVTVQNTRFANFVRWGFYVGSGDSLTFEDIEIVNCGNAFLWQNTANSRLHNIRARDISNETIQTFQHAAEMRDLTANSISHIVIHDYHPDNSAVASESTPTCFELERLTDCTFDKIYAYDYTGNPTARNYRGLEVAYATRCAFRDLHIEGYHTGCDFETMENCTVDGLVVDGEYVGTAVDPPIGVRIKSAGQYAQVDGGASRANSGGYNLALSNAVVTRVAGIGVLIQSGDVALRSVYSVGNNDHGFQTNESVTNASFFPGQPEQHITHVRLDSCVGRFNGQAGLKVDEGESIVATNCDFSDNGQDSTLGASNLRSGVYASGGSELSLNDVDVSDGQSWTKTLGLSFNPGSTTSNRYTVTLLDPDEVGVGQWLTLTNVLGPGDDTARVVEKDRDEIIVDFGAAVTLSSVGNTQALTGNWTSSGTTVTSGAGAATTELVGRCWITSGGQTRQVIKVNSNNSFVTDTAFSPALAAAAVNRIRINVSAIPSQRNGLRLDSGFAGPIDARFTDSTGNTVTPLSNGSNAGGVVRLSSGTHNVTGTISLGDGLTLEGAGMSETVLFQTAGANLARIILSDKGDATSTTGATIRDLTIDVNGDNQASGNGRGIEFNRGAIDCLIERVEILDTTNATQGHGIVIVGTGPTLSSNLIIRGCKMREIEARGVNIAAATLMSGFLLDGCDIESNLQACFVASGSQIRYIGNRCQRRTTSTSNLLGILDCTDFTISANICSWAGTVGAGTFSAGDLINLETCTGGSVVGNSCFNGGDNGIELFDGCLDVTVSGNEINNVNTNGIGVHHCSRCNVSGNTIKNAGRDTAISGNNRCGISLQTDGSAGGCHDNVIANNLITDIAATAAMSDAIRLVVFGGGVAADIDRNSIHGNRVRVVDSGWTGTIVGTSGSVNREIQTITDNRLTDSGTDRLNVKEFGARGDGVTDDTAAIQAAVDIAKTWAIGSVNGATVYIPTGHYVMSAAIDIDASGVHILGDSDSNTLLDWTGSGTNGIEIYNTVTDVHIARLHLLGDGDATLMAIYLDDADQCAFEDLLIENWDYGYNQTGLTVCTNCFIERNKFINMGTASALFLQTTARIALNIEDGSGVGMSELTGSDSNIWVGNSFASSPTILGPLSVVSADANVGVTTYLTGAAANDVQFSATTMLHRLTRSQNSAVTVNTDTIAGSLPYIGRRLTIHVVPNPANPLSQITIADGAGGTGQFQLNTALGNLVATSGQEWVLELRVGHDQTYWVEVGRAQIV